MHPEVSAGASISTGQTRVHPRTISRLVLSTLLRSDSAALDSLRARIAVGAFWSLMGAGLGQGLSFLTTVLTARLLGAERYGQLGILISTINLFATLAIVGLGTTATKYVAEYRNSDPARAGRIIGLSSVVAATSGLLVAGILILFAPYVSEHVLKSAQLAPQLRLGALILFFTAVNGAQTGALTGFEAFRELAFANALRGAFMVPCVCALTITGSVMGAILGYGIVSVIAWFVYNRLIRAQCRKHNIAVSYAASRSELSLLWKFSIPVLIAGLAFTPAAWWCNALLAATAGYVQAGIFTAAFQFQIVMLFFAGALSNIALPILSHTVPERNIEKYKRLLNLNTLATTGSVALMAIPIALFAPVLMRTYGQGFQEGATVLRILCLAAVISTLNNSIGHAIWSLNAACAGVFLSLLRSAALVGAGYVFVHKGAAGLATAYLVMAVIQTVTHYAFMGHLLNTCRLRWEAPEPAI
ncbi:MAG TPA: oligosaccharide flippase family protein [Bryobacteraceae bacterium]|nr:oligosaccharide flippase family protein [Bryobacteraceae bacterium]